MASVTVIPSGVTGATNMTVSSSYPAANAYDNSSDTSDYARYSISTSSTGYVYLTFDTSAIPANATISSVTAQARLRISSSTRVTNRVCQLYTGTTAKGSSVSFSTTSSGGSVVTLTPGTWTRSELSNLRMRVGGTGSSSSQSKYIYIYGADVTITYTVAAQDKMLIKSNGSWVEATAVYKKVSGAWVQQTDLTNVFDSDTNYVKG